MITPLVPTPQENLDEVARALLETPQQSIPTPSTIQDPESYILLEETTDYPDLLIATHKLGYTPEVEQAAKALNLTLQNTAEEKDGHKYIGNIQHQQALDVTKALQGFTLPLPQYKDFLRLLNSGNAYDGKGNQIPSTQLTKILNEVLEVRSPWRSEWLDAKFTKSGEKLQITYHKINSNGTLEEVTEQLDPDTLMKDKQIAIDSWLNNSTSQGLPRKNFSDGQLYYWYPREDRVAGFYAGSYRASLDCLWNPLSSYASLGVRLAKIKD